MRSMLRGQAFVVSNCSSNHRRRTNQSMTLPKSCSWLYVVNIYVIQHLPRYFNRRITHVFLLSLRLPNDLSCCSAAVGWDDNKQNMDHSYTSLPPNIIRITSHAVSSSSKWLLCVSGDLHRDVRFMFNPCSIIRLLIVSLLLNEDEFSSDGWRTLEQLTFFCILFPLLSTFL
jgi:hypothetical protein